MEKSSAVILSEEEKKQLLGLTKAASTGSPAVPERFEGWYSHEELKEIANDKD